MYFFCFCRRLSQFLFHEEQLFFQLGNRFRGFLQFREARVHPFCKLSDFFAFLRVDVLVGIEEREVGLGRNVSGPPIPETVKRKKKTETHSWETVAISGIDARAQLRELRAAIYKLPLEVFGAVKGNDVLHGAHRLDEVALDERRAHDLEVVQVVLCHGH